MTNNYQIKISVRNLVEFILRSGDIDNRRVRYEVDAMHEGSRIHRKIQKSMGVNYTAEVPLSITMPVTRDGITIDLTVEGRADGIIINEEVQNNIFALLEDDASIVPPPSITIDEIKGMYMDLSHLKAPIDVHKAQAMCYAYIYAKQHDHKSIGIRLTYCNLKTENLRYFEEVLSYDDLEEWFNNLIYEYSKWAVWQINWTKKRNQSIKGLEFPFSYREGQKKLVTDVYKTILRNRKLFIQAPTGERVIIVMGAINALVSRVSGTFIQNFSCIA